MATRARARERFAVRVNEQAGAILSANPDITPWDILADLGSLIDPELAGGWARSPIFQKAIAARIRHLTGMDIDAAAPADPRIHDADPFSPSDDAPAWAPGAPLEVVPVKPERPMKPAAPARPVSAPAPVLEKPVDVAAALVKAWKNLGRRDAFADSLVSFHAARGFLSSRQVWHLENLVKRELARQAWARKVAA